MIKELIKGKLPKAKLEQLVEKYPRPEYCKLLVSPKVNIAIWNQLSPSAKSSDRALQKAQQLFIFSIYATINACEKASDELKATLAHSLVLALAGNWELNLRRRESLKPDLNAQFASLCNQTTPITSELFGDDLGKEIDEVSRANKLSRKLCSKRSSPRGYQPYNAQHRQRSSSFSRRGKPYSTRPFFRGKELLQQESRSKAIDIPLQQGDKPLNCNLQVGVALIVLLVLVRLLRLANYEIVLRNGKGLLPTRLSCSVYLTVNLNLIIFLRRIASQIPCIQNQNFLLLSRKLLMEKLMIFWLSRSLNSLNRKREKLFLRYSLDQRRNLGSTRLFSI